MERSVSTRLRGSIAGMAVVVVVVTTGVFVWRRNRFRLDGSASAVRGEKLIDDNQGSVMDERIRLVARLLERTCLLSIKEVGEGIWLVSFVDYDLGYIDLEGKTWQPLDNPFGPRA
jgi:hypothetical protein